MGSPRCQWVRDRLPLLVGDDLRGLDRRRVERHLVGCSQCRQHQTALSQALETLRTAAGTPLVAPEAPSLWPALARQIRESRRPVPAATFPFPSPLAFAFAWLRVNPWPALGFGLGLLTTIGIGLGVRHQIAPAQVDIRANARPVAAAVAPRGPQATRTPAPTLGRELSAQVETPVVENPPPPPRVYDLDFGRPTPERETRNTQATY
jgi:anti-sigma factor RsiW